MATGSRRRRRGEDGEEAKEMERKMKEVGERITEDQRKAVDDAHRVPEAEKPLELLAKGAVRRADEGEKAAGEKAPSEKAPGGEKANGGKVPGGKTPSDGEPKPRDQDKAAGKGAAPKETAAIRTARRNAREAENGSGASETTRAGGARAAEAGQKRDREEATSQPTDGAAAPKEAAAAGGGGAVVEGPPLKRKRVSLLAVKTRDLVRVLGDGPLVQHYPMALKRGDVRGSCSVCSNRNAGIYCIECSARGSTEFNRATLEGPKVFLCVTDDPASHCFANFHCASTVSERLGVLKKRKIYGTNA
mmetsp:Transcript_18103/g.51069  ORF Transcript_18103/g.51069 Transcript_18103/m.51069 type:complete len:304 (+) Transcript_18103:163-1074(+)|eukprot:CAMPEP_0119133152 /NCGR_PEP_ID=MMETSP1310-20130426/13131_1 /TAXON_ID=464262 /ORGANISM="Genus nov. species nov., Strain RCC2339" /LENGTH=303 /DNA_ID=CAMNT_0007123831 /DNA_START=111 /DNA_END=1022 /DNA_ORIENTATION=+